MKIGTKRPLVLSLSAVLILVGILTGCGSAKEQAVMEQPQRETVEVADITIHEQMEVTETTDIPIHEQIEIERTTQTTDWQDAMEALLHDMYGDYREEGGEIVFVPDGELMDGIYNENIYNGIRMYALAAGISFSFYEVEDGGPEKYQEAIVHAVDRQAKVIVCAGEDFQRAVGALQDVYPQISFLLIDGMPMDEAGEPVNLSDNVHCVAFREEQSGYLAGYMAVLEGYRRFGFIGGTKAAPVLRYGYGYLQGIDDAAEQMMLDDVSVKYWCAETYEASQEVFEKALAWYEENTEVIFACGGQLYESVLEAAEDKGGMMIGADIDQCQESECILTSAVKGIADAVILSLDDYYAAGGRWSEPFAGQVQYCGAKEKCTGLPVLNTEWRFENVTTDEYYEVFHRVRRGEIEVSDEVEVRPQVSVTVEY